MSEHQIIKLLQIIGLLVGTGFGTILLNPSVVGNIAHKINEGFLALINTLTKIFNKIVNFITPGGEISPILSQVINISIIIFFSWIVLVIALVFNIGWLFWISIIILGGYALLGIIDIIVRAFIKPRRYSLWMFPVFLIIRLLSGFVLFPVVVPVILFVLVMVSLVLRGLNAVAGKDIVRRGLIFFGFLIILGGLIWEFCLIDNSP